MSGGDQRERGYLLIADMEESTRANRELLPVDSFRMIEAHNGIASTVCRDHHAQIISSVGDAIVAKFVVANDKRAPFWTVFGRLKGS